MNIINIKSIEATSTPLDRKLNVTNCEGFSSNVGGFLFLLLSSTCQPVGSILVADGLGDLVRVEAELGLELLDESDVLLLGSLGAGALVDDLLPGVALGLALQFDKTRR